MGKTRDLFKKMRVPREHSRKDRNNKGQKEAKDSKKRWQEHTEELYTYDLNDPDNHNGVMAHLEPDIL